MSSLHSFYSCKSRFEKVPGLDISLGYYSHKVYIIHQVLVAQIALAVGAVQFNLFSAVERQGNEPLTLCGRAARDIVLALRCPSILGCANLGSQLSQYSTNKKKFVKHHRIPQS
jgi:hypothetical protein